MVNVHFEGRRPETTCFCSECCQWRLSSQIPDSQRHSYFLLCYLQLHTPVVQPIVHTLYRLYTWSLSLGSTGCNFRSLVVFDAFTILKISVFFEIHVNLCRNLVLQYLHSNTNKCWNKITCWTSYASARWWKWKYYIPGLFGLIICNFIMAIFEQKCSMMTSFNVQ